MNYEHLEPVTPRVNTLRGAGVTAVNARKTSCKRGHPFANGRRVCHQCRRASDLAWSADNREKRQEWNRRYRQRAIARRALEESKP